MRSARRLHALPLVAVPPLLLLLLARAPIGETVEGPAFSTVLAIGAGLAIGACTIIALGARRSRA